MFQALRKDVARLNAMGLVGGNASCAPAETAPITVVLTTGAPAATVVDSFVLAHSGAYFFTVPAGTYRIAAFVDRNRDFVYQPGEEPAAYFGAPTDVTVAAGQKVGGLDLHIGSEPTTRLDLAIDVSRPGAARGRDLPDIQLGTVVTMDDPRFSDDDGHLGLWQPVE